MTPNKRNVLNKQSLWYFFMYCVLLSIVKQTSHDVRDTLLSYILRLLVFHKVFKCEACMVWIEEALFKMMLYFPVSPGSTDKSLKVYRFNYKKKVEFMLYNKHHL